VFADACGYVYKLDPARDLGGGWNDNTGLGALAIDGATTSHPDGSTTTTAQFALFSTRRTATPWARTARSPARWRSARTPAPGWCCSSAPAASRATR
jgi:hypothetical protein